MALSGSPVCFSMELILSEQVGGALSAAGTALLSFTEGGGSITSSMPICESFVTKSAEKPRPKMLSWFQSLMRKRRFRPIDFLGSCGFSDVRFF
jgi:hypothetical protein